MDMGLFLLSWTPVLLLTVLAVVLGRSALELSIWGFVCLVVCLLSVNVLPALKDLTFERIIFQVRLIPVHTVTFRPLFSAYGHLSDRVRSGLTDAVRPAAGPGCRPAGDFCGLAGRRPGCGVFTGLHLIAFQGGPGHRHGGGSGQGRDHSPLHHPSWFHRLSTGGGSGVDGSLRKAL